MWENEHSIQISIYTMDVSADAEFRVEISDPNPQLIQSTLQSTTSYLDSQFYITNEGIEFHDIELYIDISDISEDVPFYLLFDDYYTEVEFRAWVAEDVAIDVIFKSILSEYLDTDFLFINPYVEYLDVNFLVDNVWYENYETHITISKLEYDDIDLLLYIPEFIDINFIVDCVGYEDYEILVRFPELELVDLSVVLAEYVDVDVDITITDIAAEFDFLLRVSIDTPTLHTVIEEKGLFYFEDRYFTVTVPYDAWKDINFESYIADYIDIDFRLQSDTDNILKDFVVATADYIDINIDPILAEYEDHIIVHPTADYIDFIFHFFSEPPYYDWWFASYTADYADVNFAAKIAWFLDIDIKIWLTEYGDVDCRLKNDIDNYFVDWSSYTSDYSDVNIFIIIADTEYLDVSYYIRINDFPTEDEIIESVQGELGDLVDEDDIDDEDYDSAIQASQTDLCALYQSIYGTALPCEEWGDLDVTDCKAWSILGDETKYNKCICAEIKEGAALAGENASGAEEIIAAWSSYYTNDLCTSACDKLFWRLFLEFIESGGDMINVGGKWTPVGGDQSILDQWYESICVDACARVYYRCMKEFERTGDPSAWNEWYEVIDNCAPAGGSSGSGLGDGGGGSGGGGGAGGAGTDGGGVGGEGTGEGWSPGIFYPFFQPLPIEYPPGAPPNPFTGGGGIQSGEGAGGGIGILPEDVPGSISSSIIVHPTFGTVEWIQLWGRKRAIRHIYGILVNKWIQSFSLSKSGRTLQIGNVVQNLMKMIDIMDYQWKIEYEAIKKGIEDAVGPTSRRASVMWNMSPISGKLLYTCDGNCESCRHKCR